VKPLASLEDPGRLAYDDRTALDGGRTHHIVSRRPRVLPPRIALLAACLLAAAGCGDGAVHDGPVTLVFKHAKILGPSDPLPRLLSEFEAQHPGVRVRSESITWNSDEQHQFYVVNLEGGNPGFDVLMLDVVWVPEFGRAGWLLDLTDLFPPDELAAHFPAAVRAAQDRHRVWAIPWTMNVGLLYYRRDLLDKYGLRPPATYAELVAQVERIKTEEHDPRLDGFLWQGKQYEGLVCNALEALWANGTEVLDPADGVFPDRGRAEAALAALRELIQSGVSPPWTTAADEELTRRPFQEGRAIFLRNWPYAMDLFERPDSPVRGRVGIAPLPRQAQGTAGVGASGGAHLGVYRGTRHREQAVALVRFLTSEAAERAMVADAALSPSRMALYHDASVVRAHPSFPAIHALAMAARPRPITPYYLMLSTMLQPELSAVLVGIKTPHQAVTGAQHQLEHLLRGLR
jgi:trehalose/maltose transport system substrate-binding protein